MGCHGAESVAIRFLFGDRFVRYGGGLDGGQQGQHLADGVYEFRFVPAGRRCFPEHFPGAAGRFFLARIDPTKSGAEALTYASYIGGDGLDEPTALVADGDFIYMCGVTTSTNFPMAGSAYQGTAGGDRDAFVLKLDPRVGGDAAMVYATYLGGSRGDGCNTLAVRNGKVYVGGYTNSETFPTTGNAFQGGQVGGWDAWVAVLDMTRASAAESLEYATRLGGEQTDSATAVTADAQGILYVAGYTASSGFPVSPNAPQRAFRGVTDLFLVRIDPARGESIYSTLWGGSDNDVPTAIALDATNAVVVVGYSLSSDFPTTSGSAQATAAGRGDAFVLRVRLDASAPEPILYSTLFGGSAGDVAESVAVNAQNEIFVVGYTLSTDLPIRGESLQRANAGVTDGLYREDSAEHAGGNGTGLFDLLWRKEPRCAVERYFAEFVAN